MITDALCGFILSTQPQGDTSLRVTCFTREKGVIMALCQGGRTPKKQALLQPFVPLWLHLNASRSWTYVRQIEMYASPYVLSGPTLLAGLYVNELLTYLLRAQDAHEVLYDAYEQLLKALHLLAAPNLSETLRDIGAKHLIFLATNSQNDHQYNPKDPKVVLEILLRRFEWLFITECGYAFSWSHEARTQQSIVKDKYYHFSLGEGFIEGGAFSGEWLIAMQQARYSPEVLKMAKNVMRQMIAYLLQGKTLRARELYTAMASLQQRLPTKEDSSNK